MNYEWGKAASNSKVAELFGIANKINELLPYAELWLGTHPTAPSTLTSTSQPLSSLISSSLPFLLKILSVQKALSIQAHPNKQLAQTLHVQFPQIYKDANHKPEMAIAVGVFEALVGFRSIQQLKLVLGGFREIAVVVGDKAVVDVVLQVEESDSEAVEKAIKALFGRIVRCDESLMKDQLRNMSERIGEKVAKETGLIGECDYLVEMLVEQYPGDVGVFCALLLNYVKLADGQAVYLAANEPHAYLSGDCVECMAESDNVVRCGLTPKFKDVDTLTSMLTYTCKSAKDQILQGVKVGEYSLLYDPPIEEFSVVCTRLDVSQEERVEGINGIAVILVLDGKFEFMGAEGNVEAGKGSCWFVGAGEDVVMKGLVDESVLYRAYCVKL